MRRRTNAQLDAWFDETSPPLFATPGAVRAMQRKVQTLVTDRLSLMHEIVTGSRFQNLECGLRELLDIRDDRLLGSELVQLYNRRMTPAILAQVSQRFAGWQWHWSCGYGPNGKPEGVGCWGGVLVEQVLPCIQHPHLYEIELLVESGPLTSQRYSRSVSAYWILRMFRNQSRKANYHPMDAGGWRAMAWFSPEWSFDADDLRFPSAFASHNRDLQKRRATVCSGTFIPGNPCNLGCPLGRDKCFISRHVSDWPRGRCKSVVTPHHGFIAKGGWCGGCLRDMLVAPEERKEDDR